MGEPQIIFETVDELRQRFNDGGYQARVDAGTLTEVLIDDRHPEQPLGDEPICTRSQIIEYETSSGVAVAAIHRYLRPNGTIGLSGIPDPKMVLDRGIRYLLAEP